MNIPAPIKQGVKFDDSDHDSGQDWFLFVAPLSETQIEAFIHSKDLEPRRNETEFDCSGILCRYRANFRTVGKRVLIVSTFYRDI